MNVDAVYKDNGTAAGAFVCRDWRGSLVFGQADFLHCNSAFEAEAIAIRNSCLFAILLDFQSIIVESDAEFVLNAISSPKLATSWNARRIVEDIKKIVAGYPCIQFHCIRRTENQCCDWVTKSKLRNELPFDSVSNPPPRLLYLLSNDLHPTGIGEAKAAKEDEVVEREPCGGVKVLLYSAGGSVGVLVWDAKRVLVGAGARALFYLTLLYNVVRNKLQAEFRWWDWIDELVLLGAVPFCSDVIRLKELGVGGVVTLNEPYETLVPSSLYQDYGIRHLVLPTRDYVFAPSIREISQAVYFIDENASRGQSTFVHCKDGRGRSTTIVICYLVKYKHMTPDAAYDYVKSIRPRVLLASSHWQAVLEFYHLQVKSRCRLGHTTSVISKSPMLLAAQDLLAFDDGSVVVITEADVDGYKASNGCGACGDEMWSNLSLMYRVGMAGGSALARLSWLWVDCHSGENISSSAQEFTQGIGCLTGAQQLGGVTVVDVYS